MATYTKTPGGDLTLTSLERRVAREALARVLAGENDLTAMETTAAESALAKLGQPVGCLALVLTKAEAKGLSALAGEGAAGLLTDAVAAKAYIGNKKAVEAAESALNALQGAAAS